MSLHATSLTKHFIAAGRSVTALEGLSLDAEPGQLVALRGPSGSGKTTLLLILGGLLRPDAGKVELSGRDLYALSGEERTAFRSASISYVFQQYHLMPYLSVLENVELPALGAGQVDHAAAKKWVERLGLADRAGHRPAALSAGERQRVALARALYANPRLILADEPTGNLDAENAAIVLETLCQFVSSGGMVVLATHDDRLTGRAHATLTLEKGRLVTLEKSATPGGAR